MSECKHEWEYVRCEDAIMCAKCNVFHTDELLKERDELHAQVAVLRGALELYGDLRDFTSLAVDALQRGDEKNAAKYFDKKRTIAGVMKNALATTPSEAAERVQKLVSTLELASNCLVDGSAIKNEAQKALSEWKRDKCSS